MKHKIVIQTLLFIFLIPLISVAQDSYSKNPIKEIIVHFNEEVITHTRGLSSGLLSEYSISSIALQHSLDSANIEFMGKLIPEFKKENRIAQTRQGKQIMLSDWSNTYLIRIPTNGSVEKFTFLTRAHSGGSVCRRKWQAGKCCS